LLIFEASDNIRDVKGKTPSKKVPQKIVYLFGAGATHSELVNLQTDPDDPIFQKKNGLRMSQVSERVISKAQLNPRYLRNIEMVSAAKGSLNIELLISLIENSRIPDSTYKTLFLKRLVKEDITRVLTETKLKKFYLHKALLELHNNIKEKEELTGLISLNYDNVLDEAYKAIYQDRPNYYFSSTENKKLPLLKLHGSFAWKNIKIRGKTRSIDIIPLGVNKNYLHLPYNLIWGRALEILMECNILRIIGCKMSQNDTHLIDLLFKAQLEKGEPFEIQIISSDNTGQSIKDNYGFFPNIKKLTEIEPPLIPDRANTGNAFKVWLKYKGLKMLKSGGVNKTKYLKKVTI
jgi:hypothetical protein